MSDAVKALVAGIWTVIRAPFLVALVCLVTIATALPFGVVLGSRLRTALVHQPPIDLNATEIDPEWWMEYRAHARGLERTFTPAILGFAAPLDNLSALVDATPRSPVVIVPVLAYALIWAFLWGGVLQRCHAGRPLHAREFLDAAKQRFARFAIIGAVAATASIILYLTLHAWLFGPVFAWLAAAAGTERAAFLWRVALYALFGGVLACVSLVADYARISSVVDGTRTVGDAFRSSLRFMRQHTVPVVTLYVLTGALFVALFALYGLADRRFGGWRGVLLGQAFIVGRLAVRLTFAASELALFKQSSAFSSQSSVDPQSSVSRPAAYPGPPAAT